MPMHEEVAADLSDSAFDFKRVVWPFIKDWLGGGELEVVEAVTTKGFQRDLDTLAGIDAWHIKRQDHLIRGLASRVQWINTKEGRSPYCTFTIRTRRRNGAKTEYEKRLKACQDNKFGYLYPDLTIQAYVAEPRRAGDLLAVAAVKTMDLFKLAKMLYEDHVFLEHKGHFKGWNIGRHDNEFLSIDWSFLEACGAYIKFTSKRKLFDLPYQPLKQTAHASPEKDSEIEKKELELARERQAVADLLDRLNRLKGGKKRKQKDNAGQLSLIGGDS